MPEMTEREQVLRDLIADLREECAEKDDQIEALESAIKRLIRMYLVDDDAYNPEKETEERFNKLIGQ